MNWRMFPRLALVGSLASGCATVTGPEVECPNPEAADEKRVCADEQLTVLDREMARLYRLAWASAQFDEDGGVVLESTQSAWKVGRVGCEIAGDAQTCMQHAYASRIAWLRREFPGVSSNDSSGISSGPLNLSCPGIEGEVEATYINAAEHLAYLAWANRQVTLVRVPAASGAQYTGQSDLGQSEWWTKGFGAQFTTPALGRVECTLIRDEKGDGAN